MKHTGDLVAEKVNQPCERLAVLGGFFIPFYYRIIF